MTDKNNKTPKKTRVPFHGSDPTSELTAGMTAGLPIGLGYFPVSFAFGIAAVTRGLPAWLAVLISLTNLTSAGQVAGLELMVAACSIGEMILTQGVINLRYALMSISLSQKVDETVRIRDRFLIGFAITDEVFAVASGRKGTVGRRYLFGLAIPPIIGWTLGTLCGSVASGLLPASVMSALGIAIYGMFVAIVIPPAKESRAVALVLLCALALACLFQWVPLLQRVSSGFVIILCAVSAAALGALLAPLKEDGETGKNAGGDVK